MEATKEKHATHTPGPWEKATIGIGTNSKQVVWLRRKDGAANPSYQHRQR